MPHFNLGPASFFIGKTDSGWFNAHAQFSEHHGTKGQLDNGVQVSIKLDSATSRIGSDSTEFVIDPATGEKVFGKETRFLGATLGSVDAETMLGIRNVQRNKLEAQVQKLSTTAVEVEASPA